MNRFLVTAFLFSVGCEAFSFSGMEVKKSSALMMSQNTEPTTTDGESRRTFFSQVAAAGLAFVGAGNGMFSMPFPANAVSGLNKVNNQLKAYGLPSVSSVADGMTPLLEIYGKSFNRFPILVTFNHPITWVVTIPSIDANGEDGTIQAGEYAKGDTATFFVYDEPGHVNDIHSQPKELFEKALIKSISQKGDNMYQNFKVTKLEPVSVDGQQYMRADFKYQLLTGAGFEVDRKGVASIASEGAAVEVMWAASTAVRYKKTEQQLRDIVASFRCYADGIKLDTLG
uniref:PsbP C-terminal domain-containing protein n=1 Tax=Entomoneis paludosa TaxID=265537 RepID=A0A7S2Y714_9STRA|mmetsp:Transcript_20412/g.42852  ORF Transcript_20412/g.42852 Transcript_20412/m.42852 type:complete len:284 (+) Transcript_20412:133-984(+)|eukprot:CAMPEP_0172458056 /NCGR_PEP_ID=MMETSP1065-20121228/25651_1 /TAXON_ID=265537 /ORGANISM="Amphiprora paludosa, Strain CCMP125" /LENGTH=283 /DNA_ID=CAMNT_0013212125 /DNA_START=91 /DNA_END=942 /DNA_ORIENTATION=+